MDIKTLSHELEKRGYLASKSVLTSLYLALSLQTPLLIEGDPGCGKTELAKVLSDSLGTDLIRLQCYDGLSASSAIYEWDYMRQLLKIRMDEGQKKTDEELESDVFNERFLLKRPLLKAVLHEGPRPPVLLIDEIDRADEEFEGFLLEFLGEFQITVPEIGSFKARERPPVIITSNRTRDLGDGLRRRCIYLYVTYPNAEEELKILKLKLPELDEGLASRMVRVVHRLRTYDSLAKKPGVAETINWASALLVLGQGLDAAAVEQTVGCLIKSSEDLIAVKERGFEVLLAPEGTLK
jgi:MoxR-like ATPase